MPGSAACEIFFRCTACRRRLAAEARARGLIVECPGCGASLVVPDRSTALNPAILRHLGVAAFIFTGAALCFAAGVWLARGENKTAAVTAAVAPESRVESVQPRVSSIASTTQVSEIRQELQQARAAQREASSRYEELANWVLANMRGRFLLKNQHVARLRFVPVADDFKVNPDLADFLAVDARETDLLNDILHYGRTTLLALQQQMLMATQPAPDQAVLIIPPFEKEGAGLRDDLYAAMRSILGPDRFSRFIAVGEEEFVRAYDFFGAATRSVAFQLMPGEKPRDPPHLVIRDSWVIQKGEARRVTETSEEAVRELPARYTPYLAWLPDFVSFYAKP